MELDPPNNQMQPRIKRVSKATLLGLLTAISKQGGSVESIAGAIVQLGDNIVFPVETTSSVNNIVEVVVFVRESNDVKSPFTLHVMEMDADTYDGIIEVPGSDRIGRS